MAKWGVLVTLGAAQFLMVLDQAVMNVAISQLVEDFDTTVTTIQMVIAFYALVMAGLMLTGGKLGDIWGRRRAFIVGLCIYGVGSGLTAASWNVPSLMLGWSVLEGIGAALVIPALIALVAGNYKGADRAIAYGVLGGVAGAGIAVGPILGGWATTELSWRVVFVGEVVVAIGILFGTRLIREPEREGTAPALDWIGGLLSAAGLALVVFGVLQASNWGWLAPRNSPIEPFGFSLVPFVIGAGALVLAGFAAWERRREQRDEDPLVHLPLLRISQLRGGVGMFLAQNLILMGVFFTIPLFLQVVQGLDALETGVRMLPASAGLFFAAIAGSALAKRFAPRPLVRTGLAIVVVAILGLLTTIEPELDNAPFLVAMGVLGIGMGLIVSQLGNVVQSAVGDRDRSEAGGLQSTAQQLGSSLGTALLGAIVITGLIAAFTANVADDPRISGEVSDQLEVRLSAGGSFVAADEVRAGAAEAGIDSATAEALVENYEDAQLKALKTAFLFAAFLTVASFWTTRRLPERRFDELSTGTDPPTACIRASYGLSMLDRREDDRAPAERAAAGKAARDAAPRTSHGEWAPAADRTDPVELLEGQAASRVGQLLPLRYGRMLVSPFTFYRGAAAVMAADLADTPRSGFAVQLCGDAHLSNFGAFASPDRELVFDVNDFDETLPGPWEWDVKRLAASFSVAARDRGFPARERRRIVATMAAEYRAAMRRLAALGNLEVWYTKIDVPTVAERWATAAGEKEVKAFRRNLAKTRAKDRMRALSKLTHEVDGRLRIVSEPPLIVPLRELADADPEGVEERVREILADYRETLAEDRRVLLDSYRYVDAAMKVVGVGSVGTRAWIVLLQGRDEGDPLFLQVKEAQPSVLEPYAEPSIYAQQGERVVHGQRLVQSASDILLGWVKAEGLDGKKRDYYVRQLWDQKGSARIENMDPRALTAYAQICGTTLAHAHARSGDRIAIAGYLGKGDTFDRAMAAFAESYADQNERDFEALRAAADADRIEAARIP